MLVAALFSKVVLVFSDIKKNTIKAGGSTVRAQNVDWVMDGWSGYPLDCYDYYSTYCSTDADACSDLFQGSDAMLIFW